MFKTIENKLSILIIMGFAWGFLLGRLIPRSKWWIIPLAIVLYFFDIEFRNIMNQLEIMTKDFFEKVNNNN